MRRRALTWSLTLPLVGASVLGGHWLAFAATGVDSGPMHDYLAHAPQVLAVLVVVGLLGLAVDQRAERLRSAPFAGLGILVFAVQEHVERIAHTGDLPFLLTDRTFLLGVLLQVPVGVLTLWVARRLAAVVTGWWTRDRRPLLPAVPLAPWPAAGDVPWPARPAATRGRGPPVLLRP